MPNAPKLWLLQWKDTTDTNQSELFDSKADALAYVVDEDLRSAVPLTEGIYLYQLGTVAAKKEWTGTAD